MIVKKKKSSMYVCVCLCVGYLCKQDKDMLIVFSYSLHLRSLIMMSCSTHSSYQGEISLQILFSPFTYITFIERHYLQSPLCRLIREYIYVCSIKFHPSINHLRVILTHTNTYLFHPYLQSITLSLFTAVIVVFEESIILIYPSSSYLDSLTFS